MLSIKQSNFNAKICQKISYAPRLKRLTHSPVSLAVFFTIRILFQEFLVYKSVETNSQGNNPPNSILTMPKRTITVVHEIVSNDRTEICTKIMD